MRSLKAIVAAALVAALPTLALAQTSPGLTLNQKLTPGQWNALFAGKQDTLGYTPLSLVGGVLSGRLITAAPGASTSGLNLTPGSTPASPANGDLWVTSSGFFARINGITIGPIGGATSSSFAGTSPITVSFPSGIVTYACATCGVTGNPLSQFAATTSAQLAGVLSNETGTGLAVFNVNPTLQGLTLTGAVAGGGNPINNVIIGASNPLAGGFTSITYSTTITGTSTSAQAFAVGRQGTTTPVLNVNAAAANQVTGIDIVGAAAGSGVSINTISSGTNEQLNINAKGSGSISLGAASTGLIFLQRPTQLGIVGSLAGQLVFVNATSGGISILPPAGALGSSAWTLQTGTDTFVGRATTDALTNKSIGGSNSLGGVSMALGSDAIGDIYYRNSGGLLTRLPIGSNGQGLTVSGGLPAWAPIAGTGTVTTLTAGTGLSFSSGATCTTTCTINNTGVTSVTGGSGLTGGVITGIGTLAIDPAYGGWKLLNTLTASNSATLSDTTSLTASFNEYEIVFDNIVAATSGTTFQFQVHLAGGGFVTSGYLTSTSCGSSSWVFVNPTTAIQLSPNSNMSSSANSTYSARLTIFSPSGAAYKNIFGQAFQMGSGGQAMCIISGNSGSTVTAVDGFQVSMLAGNITSGTIRIYGRK